MTYKEIIQWGMGGNNPYLSIFYLEIKKIESDIMSNYYTWLETLSTGKLLKETKKLKHNIHIDMNDMYYEHACDILIDDRGFTYQEIKELIS